MTPNALFTPLNLGSIALKNRIVMAPLTRSRADAEGVPSPYAAQYYSERAEGAGLVIAEATQVSFGAQGYCRTPGAHTREQMAAWARVVDAVHERGGTIALQMWHCGRITAAANRTAGTEAVGPSAVQASGQMYTDAKGMQPHDMPRALEAAEIAGIADDFAATAERAMGVGFDGVEVHSANGYLLHQFLSTNANTRSDAYGGAIENRIRMPLQVVKAVVDRIGADKTGVRVSPGHVFNDIAEADMTELYPQYFKALDGFGLAYLHVMRAFANTVETDVVAMARASFSGRIIACGGYNGETGAAMIAAGGADAVAFGTAFIANPDLAARIKVGAVLRAPDQATFYTPGPKGYVDYPAMEGV
ncbi:MAG: alkene reductase [Hyphomicrobiaceae bacterium]